MATLRSSGNFYNVGNTPPLIAWTLVRGDTASFRITVLDDGGNPVYIPEWDLAMQIKRPDVAADPIQITDDATPVILITPSVTPEDLDGQFTVALASNESEQLESGDIFDIQMSNSVTEQVWTVAQGYIVLIEDVTD